MQKLKLICIFTLFSLMTFSQNKKDAEIKVEKEGNFIIVKVNKIPEEKEEALEKEIYHVVEKGDNLYRISKKYNTTVNKIKEDNNLKTDLILVGQKLKLGE
jgi:LysM repeat protein